MQFCKWHVAENIKTMLINNGGYIKEKRKPLAKLMWKYIKSENLVKLEANYATFICQFNRLETFKIKEH